jgi:hypothetical protein
MVAADEAENMVTLTLISPINGHNVGEKVQFEEWQARLHVQNGLAVAETKTAAKELGVEPQKPVK